MSKSQKRAERAREAFQSGYNCAQSVAVAFSPDYDIPKATMARIATAFGGGVSHTNDICGAVSGALMILGLHFGPSQQPDPDAKKRIYQRGEEFIAEFTELYGSVRCTDLIGYNLNNELERKAASESGAFGTICSRIVENACSLLEKHLAE